MRYLLFSAVASVIFLASHATSAAESGGQFFQWWAKPFATPEEKIDTLIITGNYVKPLMLAELVQSRNSQPILLLPATGDERVFFLPPSKRDPKPLQIPQAEVRNFVKFMAPRQILILGDERYVPRQYIEMLDPSQTVWIVRGTDWLDISRSMGKLLNLTHLSDDFQKLLDDLKDSAYYTRADAKPAGLKND